MSSTATTPPVLRRTLPGSECLPAWATSSSLDVDRSWDSFLGPYATQEYIETKLRVQPHDVKSLIHPPYTESGILAVDKQLWLYEHLRVLLCELNELMILLSEDGCNANTCTVMKATNDWEFLCAAHTQPKKCCAMDYMLHTLGGFTSLLNDTEVFPNRANITTRASQQFPSVSRRLYRLFAHGYYHHRVAFENWEQQRHSTQRFLALVQAYSLMDAQQLTPPLPYNT